MLKLSHIYDVVVATNTIIVTFLSGFGFDSNTKIGVLFSVLNKKARIRNVFIPELSLLSNPDIFFFLFVSDQEL